MINELLPEDTTRLQLEVANTGAGNTVSVTGLFVLEHREELVRSNIPFYRVRRRQDGKLGVERINFATLESLGHEQHVRKQFILHKDWQQRIVPPKDHRSIDPLSLDAGKYISLGPQGRADEVKEIRATIEELRRTDAAPMKKAEAIMSAVEKTFLINKAALQLNRAAITISDHTVASETQAMVNAAIGMVEESQLARHLFECFKSLSNGQTINHITRVFGMFSGFIHYYNKVQNQRISQNIRLIFHHEYLERYRVILPNLKPHLYTSDNLIQLPHIEPPELKKYALGAFLHDIGKMANLDYFESDSGYDSQKIREHVFVSSGLILMNYGGDHEDARIMAGDHHNALFNQDGYGVTRWERERSPRKLSETIRCISGTAYDYAIGVALGFLPVEMLAVIDIYDAMTDNSRTYKKGMSPAEAIQFMFDKPLAEGKIDPVIFDIFIDFLKQSGIDLPENRGIQFKFKQRKTIA